MQALWGGPETLHFCQVPSDAAAARLGPQSENGDRCFSGSSRCAWGHRRPRPDAFGLSRSWGGACEAAPHQADTLPVLPDTATVRVPRRTAGGPWSTLGGRQPRRGGGQPRPTEPSARSPRRLQTLPSPRSLQLTPGEVSGFRPASPLGPGEPRPWNVDAQDDSPITCPPLRLPSFLP